jgi:phosphate transport system protein
METHFENELAGLKSRLLTMAGHPETIERCLDLLTGTKCLERIAFHATNIAEDVVCLREAQDIRCQPRSPTATA